MTTVPSPCVDVCRIDERSGYCLGCYRSLDEIAGWSAMRAEDKLAVLEAVRRRRVGDLSEPDAK